MAAENAGAVPSGGHLQPGTVDPAFPATIWTTWRGAQWISSGNELDLCICPARISHMIPRIYKPTGIRNP